MRSPMQKGGGEGEKEETDSIPQTASVNYIDILSTRSREEEKEKKEVKGGEGKALRTLQRKEKAKRG